MNIAIKEIEYGSEEYELEVHLRSKILREPLGLKFTQEELDLEAKDFHIGAFAEGKIVGCLVLSPNSNGVIKMRQVAVDPSAQGLGIGAMMVEYSENLARRLKLSVLELHARESAISFYLRLNYEVYDEPFLEVSLPHRKMRKFLF